ncbi:AraC family transcriptional regulator [Bacillus pseudomycoides]|uniref:AraC family transcriptional regulator n=1 Tax=Bacillus pseudomycoides TaxID=64104 RepID=A0AA91VFL7_9BACI|nr:MULTISPECIES: effector binding domain-containing protein [Bacillus]PEB51720.1 AraC family transcriptional regulator [Bacillus sp. AFS098217]PED83688.1 AraC family transcriptional regulator [Bacillus pseudomycoides]PEU12324.1 AraC family transcriptional regulator [Bacillus sp. AFS019443]PEU21684.1 AraC family transcriptional regulator [Bacillus sp. AFS014408]PFW62045.1 AraC family transcriptional regulator [Bacillus sp. AFS075034]
MNKAITEKNIYGKKIRTNNQSTDAILNLWEEFLRLNLKGDIYAVYNNYVSDFTGDYDLHIGTEEKWNDESSVIIPAGNYHVVEVDHTDPKGVFNAWVDIWKSDIKRAYKTDFEFYSKDGSIKIFLSVE